VTTLSGFHCIGTKSIALKVISFYFKGPKKYLYFTKLCCLRDIADPTTNWTSKKAKQRRKFRQQNVKRLIWKKVRSKKLWHFVFFCWIKHFVFGLPRNPKWFVPFHVFPSFRVPLKNTFFRSNQLDCCNKVLFQDNFWLKRSSNNDVTYKVNFFHKMIQSASFSYPIPSCSPRAQSYKTFKLFETTISVKIFV